MAPFVTVMPVAHGQGDLPDPIYEIVSRVERSTYLGFSLETNNYDGVGGERLVTWTRRPDEIVLPGLRPDIYEDPLGHSNWSLLAISQISVYLNLYVRVTNFRPDTRIRGASFKAGLLGQGSSERSHAGRLHREMDTFAKIPNGDPLNAAESTISVAVESDGLAVDLVVTPYEFRFFDDPENWGIRCAPVSETVCEAYLLGIWTYGGFGGFEGMDVAAAGNYAFSVRPRRPGVLGRERPYIVTNHTYPGSRFGARKSELPLRMCAARQCPGALPSRVKLVSSGVLHTSGGVSRLGVPRLEEGSGRSVLTLSLSGPAPMAAGIEVRSDNTLDETDYLLHGQPGPIFGSAARNAYVQISAGATSATFTVEILEDDDIEAVDEPRTLCYHRTAETRGIDILDDCFRIYIGDNDYPSVDISFSSTSYSGLEGETVTVRWRSGVDRLASLSFSPLLPPPDAELGRLVTIPITRAHGGGMSSADYEGVPEAITVSTTRADSGEFRIRLPKDYTEDPDEELVLGFGFRPPHVHVDALGSSTTVTAIDIDGEWLVISVWRYWDTRASRGVGRVTSLTEAGEGVEAWILAELHEGGGEHTMNASRDYRIDLFLGGRAASDITWESCCGYVGPTGTLRRPYRGLLTRMSLWAPDDTDVEADGVFVVDGFSSPRVSWVVPATITIREDTSDTAMVSIGDAPGGASDEGAVVTFDATLSRAVDVPVTIPWTVSSNPDDVVSPTGEAVFTPGSLAEDVLVTVKDDNRDENAEEVEITFGTPESMLGGRVTSAPGPGVRTVSISANDDNSDLRVLPRVRDNPTEAIGGTDALLLFYFTQFHGLLGTDSELSEIIVRSLIRGASPSEEQVTLIINRALALGALGGIPDSHPANIYAVDPYNRTDALLMFYSLQFGRLLLSDQELREIVVNSLLPPRHGVDSAGMRALIQRGQDLSLVRPDP